MKMSTFKQYHASPLSATAGFSLRLPVWPLGTAINTLDDTSYESLLQADLYTPPSIKGTPLRALALDAGLGRKSRGVESSNMGINPEDAGLRTVLSRRDDDF